MNDQPAPTGNGQEVWPLVEQDLKDRVELGKQRYHTTLRTFNGRNALRDLQEELMDGLMYLKQLELELNELTPMVFKKLNDEHTFLHWFFTEIDRSLPDISAFLMQKYETNYGRLPDAYSDKER